MLVDFQIHLSKLGMELGKEKIEPTGSDFKIFVLNPGSTSTKYGLQDRNFLTQDILFHEKRPKDQSGRIKQDVEIARMWLSEHGISDIEKLDGIAFRGGAGFYPVKNIGIFGFHDLMLEHAKKPYMGMDHPSNGACLVANELSNGKVLCVTRDLIPTDQLVPLARFSSYLKIPRISQLHTLNLTAALEKAAKELGKPFGDMRAIGVQAGGGIGMAGLKDGEYGDIVNAGGEMWSPERSGRMNSFSWGMYVAENKLEPRDVVEIVMKSGGLQSYLLTSDVKKIYNIIHDRNAAHDHFIENREFFTDFFGELPEQKTEDMYVSKLQNLAKMAMDSMLYNIAEGIGSLHYGLFESDDLDAIVITGGMTQSGEFRNDLERRLSKSGNKILFYPGQFEMQALKEGAERALYNENVIQSYPDNIVDGWKEMLKSL
jgi:butyrate kinase